MSSDIRHQLMPNTNGLIQSSCVLEREGVQYLVKIIGKKKVINLMPGKLTPILIIAFEP